MASPVRVGLFPYLNVQPIIHGLREEGDVQLVIDLPSRIADRFRNHELDLAMVPSFEAATLEAPVLTSVCIASDGPVETVALHHRVPLARVKTIAVDEASRTSAALARLLIAEDSNVLPLTSPFSPKSADTPEADAVLVIGDPAFHWKRPGFARLDLGEEWRRRRSLPFVFAVMVMGTSAPEGFAARLGQAAKRGVDAASLIASSYNSGVDPGRAEHYMRRVIRYDLGAREKEGLALFHRLAQARSLLGELKELRFHAV
jgi:chorismate dehydratase